MVTVPYFRLEGGCLFPHCKFRHMTTDKCFWDQVPGGCNKPHCSFFHTAPKDPYPEAYDSLPQVSYYIKLGRITRPGFAIRQKLSASGIIRVWTYEKVGRVIRLESESNTSHGNIAYTNFYYLNRVKTWRLYLKTCLIFDIRLGIRLDIRLGGRVTRPWSINFTIWLWLNLGHRLLVFASTTNLESEPSFADICSGDLK